MKVFNVLILCGLFSIVTGPVAAAYIHPVSITAEELLKRDKKEHIEDFACSCIDPYCK